MPFGEAGFFVRYTAPDQPVSLSLNKAKHTLHKHESICHLYNVRCSGRERAREPSAR